MVSVEVWERFKKAFADPITRRKFVEQAWIAGMRSGYVPIHQKIAWVVPID